MDLNKLMGTRISFLRKQHGLTQEQLAEKLDISVKHCSSVERGLSRLSLEKLIEVSNIFHVSLDYLLKETYSILPTSDCLIDKLPMAIVNILHSTDERELKILNEYLNMYTKLRNKK